jgi:Tol biopolymer transport system component
VRVARVLVVPFVVAGLFGAAPSASADKILFSRTSNAGAQVWVMRSDGSGARRLPKIDGMQIDLSLDARWLAWLTTDGSLVTETFSRRHKRVVWHTPRVDTGLSSPRWSPSGTQISVTREVDPPGGWDEDQQGGFSQIFVLRADGGQRRRLSTPVDMGSPNWSPDGRRIVAVGAHSGPETCTGTPPFYLDRECRSTFHTGLWVIKVASGAAREIVGFDNEGVAGAVWSPDGRTIAFNRFSTDETETAQVWTVRPDGTGLRQLTRLPGGAAAPSWSPNGRRLAVQTKPTRTRSDIATIGANGSGLRILTKSGNNLNPDWSR